MSQLIKSSISIIKFAEMVGCADTTIYKLISDGVLSAIERGARLQIDAGTQRKRYYYYKMVTEGKPATKIDEDILYLINKMDRENASYFKKTSFEREVEQLQYRSGKIPKTNRHKKEIQDPEKILEEQIESMSATRLRKEKALAQKAELECAEKEGRLIPKEDVLTLWKEIGIKVQRAILSIPDRLAPVVAGESNSHKVHRMMTEELKYALRNLSFELKETEGG